MRANNQVHNKQMNYKNLPNQRNNITISNQVNVYQNQPSQNASTQNGPHHAPGRAIQSQLNTENKFSSNRQEQQSSNYSNSQKGNQRYAPLNTSNQTGNKYIKKLYVNQGQINQDGNKINQIEVNKQNEKNGLTSLISSNESYSNVINVNRIKPKKKSKKVKTQKNKQET